MSKYQPVIGLEVHVELNTKSKMFCGCSADYFGKKPNTHVCPVCLGLPGALPVPNKKAIDYCVMIGLSLNCEIPNFSKFDRKNYFYPDLPKGYQISQYDKPFCIKGHIVLSSGKKIDIRRVHMEEDTGKLTHVGDSTLIDFNRSGVPLVEIVTEPDFESSEEVVEYLKKLQQIVRHLGVSNADMEKGDMRLEPNISLRGKGEGESGKLPDYEQSSTLPGYKVEIKNINSFRFVAKAIEYEIKRQTDILDDEKTPQQETRGWNEDKKCTYSQRSKEEAHDYRYFPEPDIPPIRWTKEQIDLIRSELPVLPDKKASQFEEKYGLTKQQTAILVENSRLGELFEEAVEYGKSQGVKGIEIANYILNRKIDPSTSSQQIISDIKSKTINLISDKEELEKVVREVITENSAAVQDYVTGKQNAIQVLIGEVMKKTSGKANATLVLEILKKLLNN